MRDIDARNLAAALTYLGADVKSAVLELASVSPMLDAKVRATLYYHNELPKLKYIKSRYSSGLHFIATPPMSECTCVMHAVDHITRFVDDADVVQYLKAKFPEYDLEKLIC